MNKANPLINKATNEIKTQEETQMNTEYRKLLLESLEKVHQNIDQATLEQLPNLVHAEVEILTMFENADQAVTRRGR